MEAWADYRMVSSRPELMADMERRASQVRQADAKTVIGEATAGPTRSDSAARTRGSMSRGVNLSAREQRLPRTAHRHSKLEASPCPNALVLDRPW
jgi:hypothetical protein